MTQKNPTAWQANSAATANLYLYDSATYLYDSASQTYDGIVANQSFATTKQPAVWSSL